MEELKLHLTNPFEGLLDNCEMYAKMVLFVFCPFRQLTNLTCHGSYWKKFHRTKFWKKGFQILKNI